MASLKNVPVRWLVSAAWPDERMSIEAAATRNPAPPATVPQRGAPQLSTEAHWDARSDDPAFADVATQRFKV